MFSGNKIFKLFLKETLTILHIFLKYSNLAIYFENMTAIDEKYMGLAKHYATKSKCYRKQVGAVIVKNGKLISTGYNGIPGGIISCTSEQPCFKKLKDISSGTIVDTNDCRAIHAETYAIINAANREFSQSENVDKLRDATIYVTHSPCFQCALNIFASGITCVVYEKQYADKAALKFLRDVKIEVVEYKPSRIVEEIYA